MILWLVFAGATLAAVMIAGAYRMAVLRYRRTALPNRRRVQGICFYLHDENVMNLYVQGKYKALQQEVEERTRSNKTGDFTAKVQGIGAAAGLAEEAEMVIKYIKSEEPITVIRDIIELLEGADNIVYIDLINNSFEAGAGLDQALRAAHGPNASRLRSARLRDLDPFVFVSVMGRFRITNKTDKTITFAAPYGDPTNSVQEPRQVSVTCATAQLRQHLEDVPSGPFPARCLGRIQEWDPDTRKLVIDPVLAIFQ
jgi:hypothetical protein